MNASLVSRLPSSLPLLPLVLQDAATGALIASVVLCVAWLRGRRVEAWAMTSAWSTLGAAVACAVELVILLC